MDDWVSGPSPIPGAGELIAFADAVRGQDRAALRVSRERLGEALGPASVAPAAAVIAAFHALDRVADATGIRVDFGLDLATLPLRESMGLDRFPTSRNTPMGPLRRRLARLAQPLLRLFLSRAKGS